jgi:siroheme synthase-like protein
MAESKAEAMLDHHARVTLVATDVTPTLRVWADQGRINWKAQPFEEADVDGCRLVFCASADADLNGRVSRAAQARGIPVNVVDVPDLCSFIVPSILRRGHLAIAISTDGLCPSFSRHLRQELEVRIDEAYGRALEVLDEVRQSVHDVFRTCDYDARRRVMEAVLAIDVPRIVRDRGIEAAREAALAVVARCAEEMG